MNNILVLLLISLDTEKKSCRVELLRFIFINQRNANCCLINENIDANKGLCFEYFIKN